jgi:hypothetical protein
MRRLLEAQSLFINPTHVIRILGMPEADGDKLLVELYWYMLQVRSLASLINPGHDRADPGYSVPNAHDQNLQNRRVARRRWFRPQSFERYSSTGFVAPKRAISTTSRTMIFATFPRHSTLAPLTTPSLLSNRRNSGKSQRVRRPPITPPSAPRGAFSGRWYGIMVRSHP